MKENGPAVCCYFAFHNDSACSDVARWIVPRVLLLAYIVFSCDARIHV
jgi:hypothetical protein